MNDFDLSYTEWTDGNNQPQVTVMLKRNEEELVRRDARVFCEDDVIAISNELVGTGALNATDADQRLAELFEPLRTKWLRSRDQQPGEAPAPAEGVRALQQYVAVLPGADENGPHGPSTRDALNNRVLANFVLRLDEDIDVQDDIESRRDFAGELITASGTVPFRISSSDFADNNKLMAALFAAGGCELVFHGNMGELRRAISTISKDAGVVRRRKLTTNFGWTADKKAYLAPSTKITSSGIEVQDEEAVQVNLGNPEVGTGTPADSREGVTRGLSDLRVNLGSEEPACLLDLKKLQPEELLRVKRHVASDLLGLTNRTVTHTLLGATAVAVLYPFAQGSGRFALWLVGLTGSGKSFAAKLFANFFGNFPVSSAPFSTWGSTGNFIQHTGSLFKDALYLVDDYKPELVRFPGEVVKILQAYADNTGRGRLKADATAKKVRPIRGLLVCTGEDVPEHNASATARSVIVRVPNGKKNLDAGKRCLAECRNYAGVMADFIRWLLADDRMKVFAERFAELQKRFNDDVAGQQNDIRVASNLALLGAAFEQFAEYLGDVWDGWQEAVKSFVVEDLVAIRDAMLGEAKEQQASEVFLRTLADLIRYGHVRIDGLTGHRDAEHKPLIGRLAQGRAVAGVNVPVPNEGRLEVCTSLALAEVNGSLRQQGRPELKITESALLQQLREAGKLLDANGQALTPEDDPTRRVRLQGAQLRAFTIDRRELLGEEV